MLRQVSWFMTRCLTAPSRTNGTTLSSAPSSSAVTTYCVTNMRRAVYTLYTMQLLSALLNNILGHLHAIHSVLQVTRQRNQVLAGLMEVVAAELVVHDGPPPARNFTQTDLLLSNTILRTMGHVRSKSEFSKPGGGEALRSACECFRIFGNGDISLPRCEHYEVGCCKDSNGVVTREQQVANYVGAVVGLGIFGGNSWLQAPSKARWLSSSATLSTATVSKII